jgi:hypothetical protein
MSVLVAVTLGMLVVSGGFLMWVMVRALRASTKVTLEQTARLPRMRRRTTRIVVFGSAPFILLGCIAGIAVRPDPNLFKSEAIGGAIAVSIALAAMTVVTLRSMSHPSKDETGTGTSADRAEPSRSESQTPEHQEMDGGGEDLAGRRARAGRLRWPLLVVAVSLPLALPIGGAYLAHLTGEEPLLGAFVGLIAAFVVIGTGWIGLGALAARSEWRHRQDRHGGP